MIHIQSNENNSLTDFSFRLFARIYLEAPLITDNALDILKQMSSQEVSVINLLQQLVLKRPAKHLIFLNILLEQTSHHTVEVSF